MDKLPNCVVVEVDKLVIELFKYETCEFVEVDKLIIAVDNELSMMDNEL